MQLDLKWIAKTTGAQDAYKGERIQSLWSGYGELFRVELVGADVPSVVVKWVKPPARLFGRLASDVSHRRKCRSYDVEATWYRTLASRCDTTCRVPSLIDCRTSKGEWLFVLEDLDAAGFPERKHFPGAAEIDLGLAWLAAFHARFIGIPPSGPWKTGTYWHLGTRADELATIEDLALRRAAPILDKKLTSGAFPTLVHGDAKIANFCFARGGGGVAAVDFQYVGGGCGMKDVAYFLSSCSNDGSEAVEARYLDTYFTYLRSAIARHSSTVDADALETEWRTLYPIACADFYRFLAGWSKESYRMERHGQRIVREVLRTL